MCCACSFGCCAGSQSHLVREGGLERIKEFLCSSEIISITSVRGWREHNLLIPTFLKIDLVTGRFQPLTEGQMCGGVTFTASEMLAQCLILCQNSLCLSLGDQPLMPKTLNVPLDELWDIDGLYRIRPSSRHLQWRILFLWKFFILSSSR